MTTVTEKRPSLENLIEGSNLGLEVLHPGGLELTRELAQICGARAGSSVLDIASGTGETACFLVQSFGCSVVGLDASDYMIERARSKAAERGLDIQFKMGDAHELPFESGTFDVVISECTTCILDKERAIREMVRVARSGGSVGIHDICWTENTPEAHKRRLAEIEGERPETLAGWKALFERAGLENVATVDKSDLIPGWSKALKHQMGIIGQLKIAAKVIGSWGLAGYRTVRESERIFQSDTTGYGIIVGWKPST